MQIECILHDIVAALEFQVANLVEFIDKTHTLVSEDQSPGLESPLLGDWAALDVGSETHGRCTLTRREDGSRGYLLNVFEELGLGSTWVPTKQHVDVTTQLVLLTYRMSVSPSFLHAHKNKTLQCMPEHAVFCMPTKTKHALYNACLNMHMYKCDIITTKLKHTHAHCMVMVIV